MSNRAWVTLATNDSYSLGALVLANSLRRAASAHPAVVLITPSVTEAMRERLRAVFAEVILVDVMDSKDAAHLALLQRPELGITFTKIHCWNLTQYEKCVFLDADTLVVQNCDELFDRSELSAAPDVGWPDCFNSGVFVFSPSADTFSKLVTFASERGSFDGGDQGLLNSYFSDWAHGDISKHLPFLYNVTSAAFYSYIPALKHYGKNLKIIHFIGAAKPWLQQFNWQSRSVEAPEHLKDFLQLWWDLFVPQVHSQLDTQMAEVEEAQLAIGLEETTEYSEPVQNYGYYEPALDSSSEFPWHHPDNRIQESEQDIPKIDIHQFHDPWNVYRGNIPASTGEPTEEKESYQEVRQYAWDYIQPHGQHLKTDHYEQYPHKSHEQTHSPSHSEHRDIWNYTEYNQQQNTPQFTHSDSSQHQDHHHTHTQESFHHHDHYQNFSNEDNQKYFPQDDHHESFQIHNNPQHSEHHQHNYYPSEDNHQHSSEYHHHDAHYFDQRQQQTDNFQETQIDHRHFDNQHNLIENTSKNITNGEHLIHNSMKNLESTYSQFKKQNRAEQIYTVMMDHERLHEYHRKSKVHENGCEFESDSDIYEEIKPRHPYDGFYLRHRMTIDARGRKVCIHEIPLSVPSPTPSSESSSEFEDAIEEFLDDINYDRLNGEESQTGVAGNLARVVPGAPQQQEAVDELTRRQGWEAGNIDYMGADSFDNIWAKISQTLSQPPSSPPRQPSPPKEQAPVEEAKEVKEASVEQVESKPEDSSKGTTTAEAPAEIPVAAEAPVVASVPVASSEASISTETTETVAPTEAVETAAPAETIDCVPSLETTACVSISETTESVSPPKASDAVAPIEATESVPLSESSEIVAPIIATDSVSPSDASETIAPVDALQNVSPLDASVSAPPTEATESVSSSETTINVASTEATESSSSPETTVNVALTEATESVSTPEATVSVTPTEATEITVPVETKETLAPIENPVAAVQEPEPVDIPVPANESAESTGKLEDPIPVPVEAAVAASVETKEEITPSIDIPVAQEALKIDDACTPAPQVEPTASETPAPVSAPATAAAAETPLEQSLNLPEATPKPPSDIPEAASDSPPLASTPAKEEIPPAPAAKPEERRKPAGKLTLRPPAPCDALPTPDSELEDAAALAHAIIAGELRTPTVTSPSPPALSSPPTPASLPPRGLSVEGPEVPTPPVETSAAVSLSQIGVKSKPTIASQIETSVKTESAPDSPEACEASKTPKSDAPKKKIVKKVVKKVVDKEGASGGEAPVPVPPPRKKEKKPKEK